MKRFFFTLLVIQQSLTATSQGPQMNGMFKKGDAYFYWGWNRSAYTMSDIHFKGEGYDFTLYDVVAHDRPTLPISFTRYIVHFFTPQNNYKAGYFIENNLAISFGVDHMKYVMDQDQTVNMKGMISKDGIYKGYHDGPQKLTSDFLTFEHTNGLNYINVELERFFPFYHSKNGKCILGGMAAGGGGILFPKTDVRLLGYKENDQFHVSGYGISGRGGVCGRFFNHLMWRFEAKGGFINMPDIVVTEKSVPGRAKQHFFFGEMDTSIGFVMNFAPKKKQGS